MTTSPAIHSGIPFGLAPLYPAATTNRNTLLLVCPQALGPGPYAVLCRMKRAPFALSKTLELSFGATGCCARPGRLKPPQQGRVWGTVLRAQSICSAHLACFRQQQQQQLQWYTVSMHPHKGTVGLRPIPPCVRASGLCTTDGTRTSQRQQQQQQQQQRLVRRRVVSPPHNLRARKLHTHPCSRTSTSREVLQSGRNSAHMSQG